MNCIFCRIANGEIPSNKIYEDENVIAILDIAPTAMGHTIIIPKFHYENILMCDEKTNQSISKAITFIGKALLKTGAQGLNVLSNINECAGQSVMHAHVHVIPVDNKGNKATIEFKEIEKVDFDSLKTILVEAIEQQLL